MSTAPKLSESDTICKLVITSSNSFMALSLPLPTSSTSLYHPSKIRRSYLKTAVLVHPDKNPSLLAKEAFQVLSDAFECLYEEDTQREHFELCKLSSSSSSSSSSKASANTPSNNNNNNNNNAKKRENTSQDLRSQEWKRRRDSKRAAGGSSSTPHWSSRRWNDVRSEMERRERMEADFVAVKCRENWEREGMGLMRRMQKITRTLDLNAGCPETFVNPIWATVYEKEVLRGAKIPDGYDRIRCVDESLRFPVTRYVYRERETGREGGEHPDEEVEGELVKARKAATENRVDFQEDLRGFVGEILDYLHEEYEYEDMDDEVKDLDSETIC